MAIEVTVKPFRVRVSKTRPADTTAYAAGDVISESATDGAGTGWTFTNVAYGEGGGGYITKATIDYTTAQTFGATLLLFSVTPTSELDDNAGNTSPITADVDNFIGAIAFDALVDHGTGRSYSVATPGSGQGLPLKFQCEAASRTIYGVLVTRDAFTPVSQDIVSIILEGEQL
mgnify:CR=1 FL=1